MNGYAWPGLAGLSTGLGAALAMALLGPLLARAAPGAWMRLLGWSGVLLSAALGPFLVPHEPAGNRMLLQCALLYFAMKVLVQAEARLAGRRVPTGLAWLGFAFLWPGMRPWAFTGARAPSRGGARWVREGLLSMLLGAAMLVDAHLLVRAGVHDAWVAVVAMGGLGFVIAFGAMRVQAGLWRMAGRRVQPVFDEPLKATSLVEFWTRRWNLAFSEMLQVTVERPVRRKLGPRLSFTLAFLASGLLHDLAFSVPARGGYGLPTLYFVLHATLVALEPRIPWQRLPGGRHLRHAAAVLAVLGLVPLLFHLPAMRALVIPLVD
ncbi:MAG: wax synthase family protein [Planctomycetia bacterium]